MSCPICTGYEQIYGFYLEKNNYYMTKVDEIKKCCPVKVYVTDIVNDIVFFTHNGKEYTKTKIDFYKSSWRLYDSF